jgi:Lrp/AsnC family leucine-responsive transcriptional regulator
MDLDAVDLSILAALELDGRATHAAIGRELGMTGPGVYQRIRRMEEAGVICGYSVVTDPQALGKTVLAYIRVGTRPRAKESEAFEHLIGSEPSFLECHDVAGEDSYLIKVRCTSLAELRELIVKIRSVPHVTRTAASIVLMTIKEPGARRKA